MRGCFVEASAGTGKTTELVNAIAEALANGVRVTPAVQQDRLEIEDATAGKARRSRGHEDHFAWRRGRLGLSEKVAICNGPKVP